MIPTLCGGSRHMVAVTTTEKHLFFCHSCADTYRYVGCDPSLSAFPNPAEKASSRRSRCAGVRHCVFFLVYNAVPIVFVVGRRLFLYVFLVLIPFFGRFGSYYYFASHRRVVRYGHDYSIRQSLDVVFEPATTGCYTIISLFRSNSFSVAVRIFSSKVVDLIPPFVVQKGFIIYSM
jgi:hypothetical protein